MRVVQIPTSSDHWSTGWVPITHPGSDSVTLLWAEGTTLNILCRLCPISPDTILISDMWIHPNFRGTRDVELEKVEEVFLKRVITRAWGTSKSIRKIQIMAKDPVDAELYNNLKFKTKDNTLFVRHRKNGQKSASDDPLSPAGGRLEQPERKPKGAIRGDRSVK